MLFNRKCSVCQEKDARIKDLLAEVAYLRELASPSRLTVQIPALQAEADRIISGGNYDSEVPLDEINEFNLIDKEAHSLLTGTY